MNPEKLSAFTFINFEQALGFGHIAWGFEVEQGSYFFGSTDHLLRRPMWDILALLEYSRVEPGGDVDYWSGQGSFEEMLAAMAAGPHIRYHAYKQLPVSLSEAAPLPAKTAAEKLREGGWTLWDNNCVHQTDRILKIFGAGRFYPDRCLHFRRCVTLPWLKVPPVSSDPRELQLGVAADVKDFAR